MLRHVIVILGTALHMTASGVYTFVTTNASGCDSTATLNLTINNSISSTTDVTDVIVTIGTVLLILLVVRTLLQRLMLLVVIVQQL